MNNKDGNSLNLNNSGNNLNNNNPGEIIIEEENFLQMTLIIGINKVIHYASTAKIGGHISRNCPQKQNNNKVNNNNNRNNNNN